MASFKQKLLCLLLAACVVNSTKHSIQGRNETCNGTYSDHKRYYANDDVIRNILYEASLGIDPFKLDLMGAFVSGVREAIFVPTYNVDSDNVALNDFVDEPRESMICSGALGHRFLPKEIPNFTDYLDYQIPTVDFVSPVRVLNKENRTVVFNGGAFYIGGSSARRDAVLRALDVASSQIIVKKTRCFTHLVRLNTNIKPIFSSNFLQGLLFLNAAAVDYKSTKSREAFQKFVTKFGTHYQSSTHFGSAIIYEEFHNTHPKNESDRKKRLKCASLVMESEATLQFGLQGGAIDKFDQCQMFESNSGLFSDYTFPSSKFVTYGFPTLNLGKTPTVQKLTPVAIHYKLKSISSLFKESWFQSITVEIAEGLEVSLNSTALYDFFEYYMTDYCSTILGAPCDVITRTCGYSDSCPNNTECVDDSSEAGYHCTPRGVSTPSPEVVENTDGSKLEHKTRLKLCDVPISCDQGLICGESNKDEQVCVKPCNVANICGADHNCYEEPYSCKGYICVYSGPGKVLIVGRGEIEAIPPRGSLPKLDRDVGANTLVATYYYFYSCGGFGSEGPTADCYRLNRHESDASWTLAQPLPKPAHTHASVVMGNDYIWHVFGDKIHNFDSITGEYTTTSLPFSAKFERAVAPCAVSNGNYSYVIGVGDNDDEIWVNTIAQNETSWQKVGYMKKVRDVHACVWYDSNIMITGTYEPPHNTRSDVEIFNTETNTIREATPILKGRQGHAMMLYNGYPTVVGGYDGKQPLRVLESYDIGTGQWFNQNIELEKAKNYFGLVELEPHLRVRGQGQC